VAWDLAQAPQNAHADKTGLSVRLERPQATYNQSFGHLVSPKHQVHRAVHNHSGIPIVAAINPQNSKRPQRPNDALSTRALAGAHQPNRMPTYTNTAE
jgi:hypothetical protein